MTAAHYFFALALPDETKQTIWTISEELQSALPFKKWVHPADYHITLAFLGSADEQQLKVALGHVEACLNNYTNFPMQISFIDSFGSRILWAGVEPSDELNQLQKQVYSSCKLAGFQLETRPFTPHITLARRWGDERLFDRKELSVYRPKIDFTAVEVVLYRTHPEQTPKYEKIKSFYF